ncbi:carboxymuconolactone decarboxylase family protein [Methylocaldum sp.]|uniref:carboxymuconolactone decarboxylase family protein n=1 Tax=Methylocaldum sp. TaxID=1969727 RepID=UPI002D24382C|nr:carboxymuconolactone decarboxylase family protein [Methylocaldum sp.]HYE38118.1 carboxymuconolactone decarboxylase family protein [Methylocaldum sp.]
MTTQNAINPAAVLAEIEQTFGFIPNLFRAYAAYPPLLAANWAKAHATLFQGVLRREVKETIALLVSQDNACTYCIGAHTATLRMLGFSPQAIAAMENTLGDTHFSIREQALIEFARRANRAAARVTADLENLLAQDIPMAEVVEALGVMELFAAFNRFADALGVVPDSFPSPQQ